jgi:DNA-binding IclR family transcriptional regulator
MPLLPSPAVLRACDVLDCLVKSAPESFSVSELARRVDMPRATCHSVLLALAERGLVVRRGPELRYAIGPACIAIGDAARSALSVLDEVRPIADELARSLRLCVAIATRSGAEIGVADIFDRGPAFGLRIRVGEAIPLVPPFGAVFVAWDAERGVERWLQRAGAELAAAERRRYRAALAAVRRRGYSVTIATAAAPDLARLLDELVDSPHDRRLRHRNALIREMIHTEYLPTEVDAGAPLRVSQMSAPVFDRLGEIPAAIMLLGPSYDMTAAEIAALGTRLLDAARRATARAGGRPAEEEPAPPPRRASRRSRTRRR